LLLPKKAENFGESSVTQPRIVSSDFAEIWYVGAISVSPAGTFGQIQEDEDGVQTGILTDLPARAAAPPKAYTRGWVIG